MPPNDPPRTVLSPLADEPSGSDSSADPEELGAGSVVGPYVVVRRIARGGGGSVYEARHAFLQRRAALKVLHRAFAASAEMLERFVREAHAVNLIAHPNIVEIFDFGRLPDGRPYHVMPYVDGLPLHTTVTREGPLPAREVLGLLTPICDALAATHERGIVHRDMHPGNVLIVRGPPMAPYLLDFGIAKMVDGSAPLTAAGRMLGTPVAMAPEQILGQTVDARTDIYALGVLMHFALTGRYPFVGASDHETWHKHLESAPPPVSRFATVPAALDAVVRRCLEKKPDARFSDVREVAEAFRCALAQAEEGPELLRPSEGLALRIEVRRRDRTVPPGDAYSSELGDVLRILGRAEELLFQHEFSFPLRTARAILGVVPLPEGEGARKDKIESAIRLAQGLADALANRADAHPCLDVCVAVHRGSAMVRVVDGTEEIVGGALIDVEDWPPISTRVPEIDVTPAVLA